MIWRYRLSISELLVIDFEDTSYRKYQRKTNAKILTSLRAKSKILVNLSRYRINKEMLYRCTRVPFSTNISSSCITCSWWHWNCWCFCCSYSVKGGGHSNTINLPKPPVAVQIHKKTLGRFLQPCAFPTSSPPPSVRLSPSNGSLRRRPPLLRGHVFSQGLKLYGSLVSECSQSCIDLARLKRGKTDSISNSSKKLCVFSGKNIQLKNKWYWSNKSYCKEWNISLWKVNK